MFFLTNTDNYVPLISATDKITDNYSFFFFFGGSQIVFKEHLLPTYFMSGFQFQCYGFDNVVYIC